MVTHKWSPATKSSVVLARDVERHLSETITKQGRHTHRVWLASLAYLWSFMNRSWYFTFGVP